MTVTGREDGRERVCDKRDRDDHDLRDGIMRNLDLPRGEERELVVDRDRATETSCVGSTLHIPRRLT